MDFLNGLVPMCCRFSEPRKSDSSLLDWNRNVDKKNSGKSTKRPKKNFVYVEKLAGAKNLSV